MGGFGWNPLINNVIFLDCDLINIEALKVKSVKSLKLAPLSFSYH